MHTYKVHTAYFNCKVSSTAISGTTTIGGGGREVQVWLAESKGGETDLLLPPVNGWEFNDFDTKCQSDSTIKCSKEVLPASVRDACALKFG